LAGLFYAAFSIQIMSNGEMIDKTVNREKILKKAVMAA
jgi:hypothetical protein